MFRYYEEQDDPPIPKPRPLDHATLIGLWRERLVLVTVGVALLMMLSASVAVMWPYSARRTTDAIVGRVLNFPPGSVTLLQLPLAFIDPVLPTGQTTHIQYGPDHPIPIYLINDPAKGLMAYFGRDTFRGCRFQWFDSEKRFIDPCHGSAYTQTGDWVRGPARRNLDQFGVHVHPDGMVSIKVEDFYMGAVH
ncbi:MAG: Rieske 2Fe-2S domain-containing protein [Herpetosiphonaceae bacterium]|nr:Rieske 2Fe-2S domain-containing protein [Herpetosiphonaceae bacterium]